MSAPKPKKTEGEMLIRLRKRFGQDSGNGPAYAFVDHVRNDAGFAATRTIDAMAMSLWPSRGLRLSAFEIKCSRSDWLTELRNPAKSEAFIPFVDYFWLVVGDRDIVQPGELPETWGLLVPHGQGLKAAVTAPLLPDAKPLDRGMLAALLRQAGVAAAAKPEIDEAYRQGRADGVQDQKQNGHWETKLLQSKVERLEKLQNEAFEAIGTDLASAFRGRPVEFLDAVRSAMTGHQDIEHLRGRVKRLGDEARVLSEQAARILSEQGLDQGRRAA